MFQIAFLVFWVFSAPGATVERVKSRPAPSPWNPMTMLRNRRLHVRMNLQRCLTYLKRGYIGPRNVFTEDTVQSSSQ